MDVTPAICPRYLWISHVRGEPSALKIIPERNNSKHGIAYIGEDSVECRTDLTSKVHPNFFIPRISSFKAG